jgi:spore coat polysaccharide biosynthesis protein SpsF
MTQKVVAIIQARMGSTRLPGKSLMDLAGESLIYRVLERIKEANGINQIVLAVPDTSENLPLISVADRCQVETFSGAENNLLDRYYKAAKFFEADYIVRIPADNPVSHSTEISKIIEHHISIGTPGFSTNLAEVFNSGYPDGIGAEIFDFSLLEEVWENETDPEKQEHVHLNFFNYLNQEPVNKDWCPVSTIKCPPHWARPDIILDVNTTQQYAYMSDLYRDLYPIDPLFTMNEIIPWHDSRMKLGVGK